MTVLLSLLAPAALTPAAAPTPRYPRRALPPRCSASPQLDPSYMYVCRCDGAGSALPAYTPSPGIANYVNATSNSFFGPPPAGVIELAVRQFGRNLRAIFGSYDDEQTGPLSPEVKANRATLRSLKLSSANILKREEARGGIPPDTPDLIRVPYVQLCRLIDGIFEDRPPIERFFFLETVARMPYFSYVSMLHLYETLGFWRRGAETKRIHGDEEYNEWHVSRATALPPAAALRGRV